ncbi:MAG: PAS domain S-box protein [Terracidiphilus sp.]|jgi:PAS domain S-box-containing protein
MTVFEGSQPDDFAAAEQLPVEAESTPPPAITGPEQCAQDARETSQDTRETGQDLRESDQDTRESDQNLRETDQDQRESDQDLQQTSQNTRETGQDFREAVADSRQTAQDARETRQDFRKSGLDMRESDQNTRETTQDIREASEEFQISGQALVDLEVRYQLLVDSVTDYAIYMLDPEGRVVTWNVGAERSKGYKAEEILGKNFSLFFLPEDVEAGLPADELATAESQGRYETEAWRVRKDGTKFWTLVTLTAIRDPNGELHGFAKVTRDLNAQKAAEEERQRRNAQLECYRIMIESINEYFIYALDTEGRITSWGAGAKRLSGTSPEEIIGKNYSYFFTAEDVLAGVPEQQMAEAAHSGRFVSDAWMLNTNRVRVWSSGVLSAVRDEVGTLTGFIRVARIMTEQKEAEENLKALNAQLERYRFIVGSVADYVIFTLDAGGRIDSWSNGARDVLGYSDLDALDQEYALVFTEAEREAGDPRREMEEAARTGHCTSDDWRLRKDGLRIWVSGALTAVRDETGTLTGYIRVARDMTEQKRLEESLTRMTADLEQRVAERTRELETTVAELQHKNQEVEAFVYIVSHDLRAPLVNVQGFVRELEESCKSLKTVIQACPNWERCWPGVQPVLEEEIAGALHFISASATKFERLINALLGLSRQGRQVYSLVRVNVWKLVTNAVATFQQLISESGAEVAVGSLPSVTADATALGQVFSNLIGNCLKYRSPERPLRIEVGGQPEDGMVHYWVKDNGLGIPDFAKPRLFQVFQRFHSQNAEGEGMGLAIAHRIVERHGGKIWAESREGVGTAFHFSLPANPVLPARFTQGATDREGV